MQLRVRLENRELRRTQRRRLGGAFTQRTIEIAHQGQRDLVGNAPEAGNQRASAGIEEAAPQAYQLIACHDLRAASLAGTERHQLVSEVLLQEIVGEQLTIRQLDKGEVRLIEAEGGVG